MIEDSEKQPYDKKECGIRFLQGFLYTYDYRDNHWISLESLGEKELQILMDDFGEIPFFNVRYIPHRILVGGTSSFDDRLVNLAHFVRMCETPCFEFHMPEKHPRLLVCPEHEHHDSGLHHLGSHFARAS